MENSQQKEEKKISIWARLAVLVGVLIVLSTCVITIGAIYLDIAGTQTTGTLLNVATCSGGRNCWTGKVEFKTNDGEDISFYPQTNRFIFDLDGYVTEGYREVDVRYLESFPDIAKVSVVYKLEYLNKVTWSVLGSLIAFFGWVATRKRAIVLDLRKGNK